jgi:hypothetical protein
MNAVTPIGRSVRDAALDLINAAETLRETRAESLSVADAMRERQHMATLAYFQRKDAANG